MRASAHARGWLSALAALATGALAGCAVPPYDHMDLTAGGAANASTASITLSEGDVISMTATPMSADGPLGGDFTFALTSSNVSVLGIDPALGQPAGKAVFVVFGASPGTAQVEVTVNGEPETPIPATVTPQ
jgi:hypothetical protein